MLVSEELRKSQAEWDKLTLKLPRNEQKYLSIESKLSDVQIRLKEKEVELEQCIAKYADDEDTQLRIERDDRKELQARVVVEYEKRVLELDEDRISIISKSENEINDNKKELEAYRNENQQHNKKLMEAIEQLDELKNRQILR